MSSLSYVQSPPKKNAPVGGRACPNRSGRPLSGYPLSGRPDHFALSKWSGRFVMRHLPACDSGI